MEINSCYGKTKYCYSYVPLHENWVVLKETIVQGMNLNKIILK